MTVTEFLMARIAEDEAVARDLLTDLEGEVDEDWTGLYDERGPMTPDRLLSSQLLAQYDGQSRRRSFARGQQIATLSSPARALAECAAKRAIVADYLHQCRVQAEMDRRNTNPAIYYGQPSDRVICQLAAVYATHPDYQEEWKP